MVSTRLKKGFSLAEALVVMVIISILFAVATKVLTTRPKPKRQVNSHGYYECYNGSDGLKQRYVREGVASSPKSVSTCTFEPPSGVSFFNLNSYAPQAYSSFEPNINNNLKISIDAYNITVYNEDGDSINLNSNASGDEVELFLKTFYPSSKLYNDGVPIAGLLISW